MEPSSSETNTRSRSRAGKLPSMARKESNKRSRNRAGRFVPMARKRRNTKIQTVNGELLKDHSLDPAAKTDFNGDFSSVKKHFDINADAKKQTVSKTMLNDGLGCKKVSKDGNVELRKNQDDVEPNIWKCTRKRKVDSSGASSSSDEFPVKRPKLSQRNRTILWEDYESESMDAEVSNIMKSRLSSPFNDNNFRNMPEKLIPAKELRVVLIRLEDMLNMSVSRDSSPEECLIIENEAVSSLINDECNLIGSTNFERTSNDTVLRTNKKINQLQNESINNEMHSPMGDVIVESNKEVDELKNKSPKNEISFLQNSKFVSKCISSTSEQTKMVSSVVILISLETFNIPYTKHYSAAEADRLIEEYTNSVSSFKIKNFPMRRYLKSIKNGTVKKDVQHNKYSYSGSTEQNKSVETISPDSSRLQSKIISQAAESIIDKRHSGSTSKLENTSKSRIISNIVVRPPDTILVNNLPTRKRQNELYNRYYIKQKLGPLSMTLKRGESSDIIPLSTSSANVSDSQSENSEIEDKTTGEGTLEITPVPTKKVKFEQAHKKVTKKVKKKFPLKRENKEAQINLKSKGTKKMSPKKSTEKNSAEQQGKEDLRCGVCSHLFETKEVLFEHVLRHTEIELQEAYVKAVSKLDKKGSAKSNKSESPRKKARTKKQGVSQKELEEKPPEQECSKDALIEDKQSNSNKEKQILLPSASKSPHKIPSLNENPRCRVCSKSFETQELLLNHVNGHSKEQIYSALQGDDTKEPQPNEMRCCICSKLFEEKTVLFNHVLNHSEEELRTAYKQALVNGVPIAIVNSIPLSASSANVASVSTWVLSDEPGTSNAEPKVSIESSLETLLSTVSSNINQGSTENSSLALPALLVQSPTPLDKRDKKVSVCPCHANLDITQDGNIKLEISLLCQVCDVLFRSSGCLEMHYRSEPKCKTSDRTRNRVTKLFCTTCCEILDSMAGMKRHLTMHANLNRGVKVTFLCNICNVVFCGIGVLFYTHWFNHMRNPLYVASIYSFPKNSLVNTSQPQVVGERKDFLFVAEHVCKSCRRPFASEADLEKHTNEPCKDLLDSSNIIPENVNIRMTCSICKVTFDGCSEYEKHLKNHSELFKAPMRYAFIVTSPWQRAYICEACKTIRKSLTEMEEHWKCHAPYRDRYFCSSCTEGCDSFKELIEHCKQHEGNNWRCTVFYRKAEYCCNHCSLGFESAATLKEHVCLPKKSAQGDKTKKSSLTTSQSKQPQSTKCNNLTPVSQVPLALASTEETEIPDGTIDTLTPVANVVSLALASTKETEIPDGTIDTLTPVANVVSLVQDKVQNGESAVAAPESVNDNSVTPSESNAPIAAPMVASVSVALETSNKESTCSSTKQEDPTAQVAMEAKNDSMTKSLPPSRSAGKDLLSEAITIERTTYSICLTTNSKINNPPEKVSDRFMGCQNYQLREVSPVPAAILSDATKTAVISPRTRSDQSTPKSIGETSIKVPKKPDTLNMITVSNKKEDIASRDSLSLPAELRQKENSSVIKKLTISENVTSKSKEIESTDVHTESNEKCISQPETNTQEIPVETVIVKPTATNDSKDIDSSKESILEVVDEWITVDSIEHRLDTTVATSNACNELIVACTKDVPKVGLLRVKSMSELLEKPELSCKTCKVTFENHGAFQAHRKMHDVPGPSSQNAKNEKSGSVVPDKPTLSVSTLQPGIQISTTCPHLPAPIALATRPENVAATTTTASHVVAMPAPQRQKGATAMSIAIKKLKTVVIPRCSTGTDFARVSRSNVVLGLSKYPPATSSSIRAMASVRPFLSSKQSNTSLTTQVVDVTPSGSTTLEPSGSFRTMQGRLCCSYCFFRANSINEMETHLASHRQIQPRQQQQQAQSQPFQVQRYCRYSCRFCKNFSSICEMDVRRHEVLHNQILPQISQTQTQHYRQSMQLVEGDQQLRSYQAQSRSIVTQSSVVNTYVPPVAPVNVIIQSLEDQTSQSNSFYQCTICKDSRFISSEELYAHMASYHAVPVRYVCDYCIQRPIFDKKETLRWHVLALHAYGCSTCFQRFRTSEELRIHRLSHEVTL
ncbi:uncharacterized protein LOC105697668 isoform X2 [Orussus abietinus]|nr:uncharacterized protein LOC105697668 isoform X2 [Orussus abietinus]